MTRKPNKHIRAIAHFYTHTNASDGDDVDDDLSIVAILPVSPSRRLAVSFLRSFYLVNAHE